MTDSTDITTNGANGEAPDAAGSRPATLAELDAAFADVEFSVVAPAFGPRQDVATVSRELLVAFVTAVRESGFRMFVDLCAVDYLRRDPRFEVVINVLSIEEPARLRIRVPVPGRNPVVPSITSVYPGANFFEREAYDLFGIEFAGHPDLSRILLPDDWEGHPLRKDHEVGSVPVQFKGAHKAT